MQASKKNLRGTLTAASEQNVETPPYLKDWIYHTFAITQDPCPLYSINDALHDSYHWGKSVFVNPSNLYAAAKALAFDIDYKLLRKEFMQRGKLLRAFYYTALLENDDYSPIRPLVDWLHYNGFNMVTKPAKEFIDSQGRRKIKGNMDIELAVDAMEIAPHVDHIVLFSGDGDFRPLVESLQRKGVRVSVVSTIRSQPPMIADDLRRQADNFIELDELKDVVGRPPREPRVMDREAYETEES